MATDEDRLEDYRQEEALERAIKRGSVIRCSDCGEWTAPHFGKYDDEYEMPVCLRCLKEHEANL